MSRRYTSVDAVICILLWCLAMYPTEAKSSMWGLESMISYAPNSSLYVFADSFKSFRTLQNINFYEVPLSKPSNEVIKAHKERENLGEVLLGYRLVPTNFSVSVLKNTDWQSTGRNPLTCSQSKKLIYMAKNRYRGTLFLDGLPALLEENGTDAYRRTFYFLGNCTGERCRIQNAFHFRVYYTLIDRKAVITRFTVMTQSLNDAKSGPLVVSDDPKSCLQLIESYYKVEWVASDEDVAWNTRWDIYRKVMRPHRSKGHFLSAAFSVLLVAFLGLVVGLVLARTVRRDLLDLDDADMRDDLREEKGWKLVRGDVFRAPSHPVFLSSFVGGGCQLLSMVVVTFFASILGLVHPSQRGHLLTGLILFFILSSFVAGFVVSTMLKFFGQRSFKQAVVASLYLPAAIGVGYLTLNLINWKRHSTTAIPFTTLLSVVAIEIFLALPLVVLGVYVGFKRSDITAPVRVSLVPRMLPLESREKVLILSLLASVIPFAAAHIEITYIMSSLWRGEMFYQLGMLALVGFLTFVICGEVSIVLTYSTLTLEDYRWWWRSFYSLAGVAVLTFLYSVYYMVAYLTINKFASVLLYLGYMAGACTLLGLMIGTLGFLASACFVYFIYSSVKAD